MKMDILRCKSPEMVEKEIWIYLLAYNLLGTVMAVAASANGVEPREISFKGAKQARWHPMRFDVHATLSGQRRTLVEQYTTPSTLRSPRMFVRFSKSTRTCLWPRSTDHEGSGKIQKRRGRRMPLASNALPAG